MPRTSKLILAIDLGTSGPKVAIASTSGKIFAHDFEPTRYQLLPNGGAEQNPDEWWHAILRACRRVLSKIDRTSVRAVCCTAQWSGTVPVDENGRHLMNAIIWMDARGQKYVRQITGGLLRVEGYGVDKLWRWIPRTGGIPSHSGKDSLAHILLIKCEFPDIYEKTYKFLEPKDYLNFRLCGKPAATFDSIALHWLTDNRRYDRIRYDPVLLKLAGVEREKLPDLVRAVDILGPLKSEVADALGLGADVQVVSGTPDMQSAAIGSGAVKDFEPHLYIGTSSWLSCHVPYKKTDLLHNMAALPAAIPGRYFVANEQETSGSCLNFLRNNLLPNSNGSNGNGYAELNRLAKQAPAGSDKVIFTPWLYGERTPIEDGSVRGGFYNVSLSTTRVDLIRAVFEGVAYNSRWLLRYVEKFVGRRFDAINMIGGGAKSTLWCQIHADVFQRVIRQVKEPVLANVRGTAAIAAVALGEMSFKEVAEVVEIERIFEPDVNRKKTYDELFGEFLNIYKQNRKMFARLNASRS